AKAAKEQPTVAVRKPAASNRAATTSSQLTADSTSVQAPAKPGKAPVPAAEILASIDESASMDGWAALSTVRQKLGKRLPTFNLPTYGYSKFSDLVAAIPGVEAQKVKMAGGGTALNVRRRNTVPPA